MCYENQVYIFISINIYRINSSKRKKEKIIVICPKKKEFLKNLVKRWGGGITFAFVFIYGMVFFYTLNFSQFLLYCLGSRNRG